MYEISAGHGQVCEMDRLDCRVFPCICIQCMVHGIVLPRC